MAGGSPGWQGAQATAGLGGSFPLTPTSGLGRVEGEEVITMSSLGVWYRRIRNMENALQFDVYICVFVYQKVKQLVEWNPPY